MKARSKELLQQWASHANASLAHVEHTFIMLGRVAMRHSVCESPCGVAFMSTSIFPASSTFGGGVTPPGFAESWPHRSVEFTIRILVASSLFTMSWTAISWGDIGGAVGGISFSATIRDSVGGISLSATICVRAFLLAAGALEYCGCHS